MTTATTRENNFNEVSKEQLVASAKVTVNNLYEVLENCQTERESKQISGCIYLLETSLFGESSQNPFVKI
jgi:hypothetical protein